MDLEKQYLKCLQNNSVRIGDGGDDSRVRGEYRKMGVRWGRKQKKMMTNGRIRAETSEKTIKNGTSKDGGGKRKTGVQKGGQVWRMSDGSRLKGQK